MSGWKGGLESIISHVEEIVKLIDASLIIPSESELGRDQMILMTATKDELLSVRHLLLKTKPKPELIRDGQFEPDSAP